jgi:hypothetical protein
LPNGFNFPFLSLEAKSSGQAPKPSNAANANKENTNTINNDTNTINYDTNVNTNTSNNDINANTSEGCGLLLKKYVQLLEGLVTETLSLATALLKCTSSSSSSSPSSCPSSAPSSPVSSLLPLLYKILSKDILGETFRNSCSWNNYDNSDN